MNRDERYDQRYFDRWYRDPQRRASGPAKTARKVRLGVAVAEYYLGRPIRSVLDIGCGEGQWALALRRSRPRASYLGIDASRYAVARFGRSRNLSLGRFGALPPQALARKYDLIVCSDALNYVPLAELDAGLCALVPRLQGVAFLEIYTHRDAMEGDVRTWKPRSAGFYRRLFAKHGLVACGSHFYVGPELAWAVKELERSDAPR